VTCTNSGLSDTSTVISIGQNLPMQCHCTPSGGTGSTAYYLNNITSTNAITNFVFTATSYQAFRDQFNTLSFSEQQGGSVNISMTPSGSTNYFYCWIDWNQDGDFADAGETIWNTTSYTSSYSGVIDVPASQAIGSYKVRFAQSYSGTISYCGPAPYGSYVDAEL